MVFTPWLVSEEPIIRIETCDKIVKLFQNKTIPATVKGVGAKVDTNIRSAKVYGISKQESKDLYRVFASFCNHHNNRLWNFELNDMDPIQFIRYDEGDHYKWHLDIGGGPLENRKLSIIVPLTNPDNYKGGKLLLKIGDKDKELVLKQGHAILFPSYILHKVTPVTEGHRFMLVGWMKGKTPFQ